MPEPDPAESAALRELLTRLGYRIAIRENGWVECLLVRQDERWLGTGLDPEAALRDAVGRAFPSEAARVLLRDALARQSARLSAPPPPTGKAISEPAAAADVEVPPLVGMSRLSPLEAPLAAPTPGPSSAPYPASDPRQTLTIREALIELRELYTSIEADRDELALATPKRQRLVLLAWMARARSYQEDHLDDERVNNGVHGISKVLGALAADWWPGSVPALQLHAQPGDALRTMDGSTSEPKTWGQAADIAEQALRELEAADEAEGLDASGWADTERLRPLPRRPDTLLAQIVAEAEEVGGRLGGRAQKDDLPRPDQLLRWAGQARWLREAVDDIALWAKLIGRLRFWTKHRRGFDRAEAILDPHYVPDRAWGQVLAGVAQTPQRAEDQAKRAVEARQLLLGVPAAPDREAVRAWLHQALPITDTHHAQVVTAMTPFREIVSAFLPADFAGQGRRIHRRLKKLQDDLSSGSVSAPTATVAEAPAHGAEIEIESPADKPLLLERVVLHTRGKRALFVSNRPDPELQDRLREALGFVRLDWAEGEPRRIDAVAEALAADGYDFVLGATGFIDHAVDRKLLLACKRSSTTYIRVGKGREGASVRSLARHLGLGGRELL